MKRLILLLMMSMFLVSFASAYEPHQQNTDYDLIVSSNKGTECLMTYIKYPDGTKNIYNLNLTKNDTSFYSLINSTNFTQLGETALGIRCSYGSETLTDDLILDVTSSGIKPDIPNGIANMLLILFFILLITGFYITTKKVNFENWQNSIIRKYQNKNYVKLVLSSIFYNIMKNTYVIYYLMGFPLIIILTDMAYTFGVNSMVSILSAFLYIYTVGSLIVGVYFIGYTQEWLMTLLNQIKDMDWGMR